MNSITEKLSRKIDGIMVTHVYGKPFYKYLYSSYWHYRVFKKKKEYKNANLGKGSINEKVYISSGMNYGGGIAHQMHCWYSGYALSRENHIGYAYPSFWINGGHTEPDDYIIKYKLGKLIIAHNSKVWDKILGFSDQDETIDSLLKRGYKKKKIPYYTFEKEENIIEFTELVNSYRGKKVILIPRTDQRNFYPSEDDKVMLMRYKFWGASERKNDNIVFSKECISIAVHIRRGDVSKETYADRYLDFEYYGNAIKTVLSDMNLKPDDVCIYIFSEGNEEDFEYFNKYPNVKICLDWDSKKTFLHMVYADAVIAGVSGFSVNAAIIGNGKRYVYKDSFTEYCSNLEWVILDKNGNKTE